MGKFCIFPHCHRPQTVFVACLFSFPCRNIIYVHLYLHMYRFISIQSLTFSYIGMLGFQENTCSMLRCADGPDTLHNCSVCHTIRRSLTGIPWLASHPQRRTGCFLHKLARTWLQVPSLGPHRIDPLSRSSSALSLPFLLGQCCCTKIGYREKLVPFF